MEKNFVPLQLDTNKNKALVTRFGIKWTPTILVLDIEGDEHHRFVGYLPPDDFVGQILLGRGKVAFNSDNFEEAIQNFQEVLVRYPKTEAAPEAQYYLAVTRYKASGDPKELKRGFETLQRDFPGSEWTKKAQVYALIP